MRRSLLGALLVCGCFSPNGSDTTGASGETSTAAPGTTTAGTDPATAGITTTTGTTGPGVTSTGVPTTGLTTAGPTTLSTTEPATTDTTDTTGTGTTDGTTTDPGGCNPARGPCFTCEAGTCVQKPAPAFCVPGPGACAGTVWGEANGTCYEATADSGYCDDEGTCQPSCNKQGAPLLGCDDATCVLPNHPCQQGAAASDVNLANLCETGGVTTLGCNQVCNGNTLDYYACQDTGKCVMKNSEACMPYACDPERQRLRPGLRVQGERVHALTPPDVAPPHDSRGVNAVSASSPCSKPKKIFICCSRNSRPSFDWRSMR